MKRKAVQVVGPFDQLNIDEHIETIRQHNAGLIIELVRIVGTLDDDEVYPLFHDSLIKAPLVLWVRLSLEIALWATKYNDCRFADVMEEMNRVAEQTLGNIQPVEEH